MPIDLDTIHGIEYVTDATGKRTKAILPLNELEELVIDLGMAQASRDVDEEDLIPWEQAKAELISMGKMDA